MTKPRAHHGEPAVSRTAPLAGVAYTLTFLWYARRGQLDLDLARARELSPWHRHKTDVSFHDMRRALARQLLADLFRRTLSLARSHQNPPDLSAWEALAAKTAKPEWRTSQAVTSCPERTSARCAG